MRFLKQALNRILGSDAVRGAFCWLVSVYLRLVRLTGRWRIEGDDTARRLWREGKPFILCFWHNRLMMMPFAWNPPLGAKAAPIHMLISAHRDGRLIARTVSHFGIQTIEGSDNRLATSALLRLVRTVRGGSCVGITPDSPPGPRMRAKAGAAALARLAQVPVIPASYSMRRRRVWWRSWDRLIIPVPFSSGLFLWGAPIQVAGDADDLALERARLAIEESLTSLSNEADRRFGHAAIEPDPPLDAANLARAAE